MRNGAIVVQKMDIWIQTTSNMYHRRDCRPLTADITTANVQDNQTYVPLTSSSSVFSLPLTCYMVTDPGYDDKNLYKYSKKVLGIDLVCPVVERYKSTPKERLDLVCFYKSALGQAIYSQRRISIEPLIEHIKSVFRIDPLPARGFSMISAIVLLSVLLYQLMVYITVRRRTLIQNR